MELNHPQKIILAVSIVFFVLGSLFVGLYLSSCLFVVKRLRFADYLMLLAWLFDLGLVVCVFVAIGKGLGLHTRDIKPQDKMPLNKAVYAFVVFYDSATTFAKSSILIFFLALSHDRRPIHFMNYMVLLVVVVVGTALILKQIFRCHPFSAAFTFETEEQDGRCDSIFIGFLAASPYNIITDMAILLVPIPLLTRMALPLRQKVILVITFGAAIFVIAIDLTRLAFLEHNALKVVQEHKALSIGKVRDVDYTWIFPYSFMWSTVEMNMTLICACVPTLKPLAAKFSPSLLRNPKGNQQIEEGNFKESQQGSETSETVTSELIDVVTSRSVERSRVNQDANQDLIDPSEDEYEPPIFNLLSKTPASMPRLNNKQSFAPNVLTTTLFFLWGFSLGLIGVLNLSFGAVLQLTPIQRRGIHAAYFGGYMAGAILFGRLLLKRVGFAGTIIAGLYIYACGALLFWPSAILGSLPTFIVSNVIIGIGLAQLETDANLFVSICGPLEFAEIRLSVAQSFQGIGNTCAIQLAERALFKDPEHSAAAVNAQWTYLFVAFVAVLLSILFYYLPLPEAPNDDLRQLAAQRPENRARIWGLRTSNVNFIFGACSMFLYVAGQEAHAVNFRNYVKSSHPRSSLGPQSLEAVGYTAWTVGRLIAALIMWRILKPRQMLLTLYVGIIVIGIICMHTTGLTAAVMATLEYFFSGGIFPIIFAISVRGTAQHAKTAASLLAAGIGGGAWGPFPQYQAALSHGQPWSYSVMIALWSASALFAIYLNFVPQVRKQVDPVKDDYIKEE